MKKLFLAALLVVGLTTFAQEQKDKPKRAGMENLTQEQKNQMHLKRLTSELDLNAKQQLEVGKIIAEQGTKKEAMKAKHEAMKAEQKRPTDEERAAIKKQMLDDKNAMNDKMKAVLSPEQFVKWNEIREKNKAKRGERKGMKRE
ncbi:hypothetical protein [Flavobacterium psychrotolerans]|uniref:DUF4890 domain-containing protein n=1 Tax=Flavobacterium psychrotolerans TaxID=2169410 RepID=A0A2U1JID7_9FLAO|nr:hypothetical protein [Flavobacterium psychrotolerans]PWA04658.1 hypothetical protein DB895_10385 [Flavobacterium psychrotolerans]